MTSQNNKKETVKSGNTKSDLTITKLTKHRHYLLTLNEVERFDKLKQYLTGLKSTNYIIAAKEIAPTTKHEHIHIYVQFKNPLHLSVKKCEGAHIDACRGSPQQVQDYVKKDGKIIFEEGILRKTGALSIKDVKEMNREERDDLDIRYYNIVKQINHQEDMKIDINEWFKEDMKVVYICGPSGSGKSKKAVEVIKEHTDEKINIVKHVNNFWEGADGETKTALYDEFRPSHMQASEFINFIDYNKHLMNIKGGEVRNNYNFIVITSIFKPTDIYKNLPEEDKIQWLRRMEIINLYPEELEDNAFEQLNKDNEMLFK